MCKLRFLIVILFLPIYVFVSACGGGEAGDGNNTPPPLPLAPEVLDWSPAEQEMALVTTVVTARFDREMDKDTINDPEKNFTIVEYQTANEISGSVEYFPTYEKVHNYVAAFTSSKELEPGKKYTATVTTDVKDLAGNSLARDHVWDISVAPAIVPVSTDAAGSFGTSGIGISSSSMPDATGEYIVFASSDNFAGIDTGGISQIYRKNTVTGRVEIVSASNFNHNIADGDSITPRISDSGRYVVFSSRASNLISCIPTHGKFHVYLKDMRDDSIMLLDLSITKPEEAGNGNSTMPDISGIPDTGSGKYVVFESTSSDLHAEDTDTTPDIFLINVISGTVSLVSASLDQENDPADGASSRPRVSDNGNRVVFDSVATNLVANDTNGKPDIFLHDVGSSTTTRLSVDANGDEVSGGSVGSTHADISADGIYTVFQSDQPTLDGNINNNKIDIFIRETTDVSTIKTLSLADGDADGANGDSERPSISLDGRYITFESEATDLVASDTNGAVLDIFVRERNSTTISLLSIDNNNTQGNQGSINAVISANGRYISFTTSNNFDTADGNDNTDIYRVYNAELR